MKIAVYAIALNEEKHVKRFVKACRGADLIVVADTGSTDKTSELLLKLNVQVHHINVKPFRFDDARNAALALVPEDVDICVSLDLDEIPEPDFFDKIREAWQPDTTRAWVGWDTGTTWMNNNRVHARHGYRWIKPCHEVTVLTDPALPSKEIIVETLVKHAPDDSKPRSQYLGMLEWAVREDPSDARMLAYLAREYYFHENWEKVIETAGTLESLDSGWNVERSATWRNCGYAYQQLGNDLAAGTWYIDATEEAPDQLENWFSLSQFYYTQSKWQRCYEAAIKVLDLKPDSHYLSDESVVWRMYDMLALSSWHLGQKGSAKKYARIASELNPDDERLKNNYAFMVSSVVKEYKDGLQNGLSDPGL